MKTNFSVLRLWVQSPLWSQRIFSLCGVSWGSDPQNLLKLYTGAVRPKLKYMSRIVLDCTKPQFLKLERIQYKCLRIALGAMNSTPNLALEQLGNLMPIRKRFSFFANNIANQRRCSSFSKYYTAGSKSQSTVSCAVWHPESQSSATFTLHSESSIYTAEPYAIYKTTLKTF